MSIDKGVPVISRSPASLPGSTNGRWIEGIVGGMSLKSLEAFCRRFATGLRSGIDVLKLLEMESRFGSARHRDVAQHMRDGILQGESLSGAMLQQGEYFPKLLIRIVRAGEHSGRVEHVFLEMANHYGELKKARSQFLSQVTFPLISLAIAFLVITLMIYVNGFMQSGSMNDEPFDLTGIGLRGASGVIWFWLFSGVAIGSLLMVAFGIWKNWFQCHRRLVPMVRNIPVIGPVVTNTALARLSMTMSMMLGAGVDAKRTLRESLLATGNQYYTQGISRSEKEIQQGKSFAESLAAPGLLPDEFIQVVEVGEISGSDSESLERLAATYREKASASLQQLAIFAGLAVWFAIAAILIIAIFTIFFQIMEVYTNAGKI